MTNDSNLAQIHIRMRTNGISQFDVSKLLGLKSHSTLNQWLNGHLERSPEFERQAAEAVDILVRANVAAEETRNRVLSEFNL